MTDSQVSYLLILAASFILLLTERLRTDLVGLLIIVALYCSRVLPVDQALAGFASEPAIIVASVFVLSTAIHQTGVSRTIGSFVGKLAGHSVSRALMVLMPAVSLMSAFTHHVTTTAVMLPVTLELARARRIPASQLLMPLAIAASLGTTATIIGAPAFLIADKVLKQAGRPGLTIFSIAPIGVTLVFLALLFMMTVGRWLLPKLQANEDAANRFRLDRYFTEMTVLPGSPLVRCTIAEVERGRSSSIRVVGWMRDKQRVRRPYGDQRLQAGDVLLIRTTPEELLSMRQEKGVQLHAVQKFGSERRQTQTPVSDMLVQAVVAPDSELQDRSLGELAFQKRYGAIVVGLWRRVGWLQQQLARIKLKAGDVLVLQGDADALNRIASDKSFLMLMPLVSESRVRGKAGRAALILAGTIALAACKVSVAMASLCGALLVVLTGCISVREAYRSIDARIYVFIAGAIPLGEAMVHTGTADRMAALLQNHLQGWHAQAVLVLLFWVVAVATQFMSDAGTTAIFAPVAVAVAGRLGHAPEPYAVTVAMAAVAAFLTPIGHHGNLLVYGPGRYKFGDFIRVGTPLTVLVCLVVVLVAPLLWPG